ncbi:hypothetical protein D3C75_616250 [compost metagenome]
MSDNCIRPGALNELLQVQKRGCILIEKLKPLQLLLRLPAYFRPQLRHSSSPRHLPVSLRIIPKQLAVKSGYIYKFQASDLPSQRLEALLHNKPQQKLLFLICVVEYVLFTLLFSAQLPVDLLVLLSEIENCRLPLHFFEQGAVGLGILLGIEIIQLIPGPVSLQLLDLKRRQLPQQPIPQQGNPVSQTYSRGKAVELRFHLCSRNQLTVPVADAPEQHTVLSQPQRVAAERLQKITGSLIGHPAHPRFITRCRPRTHRIFDLRERVL